MPEAQWIEDERGAADLARALGGRATIGIDTEFLRERTFYPRLCLVQIAAGAEVWLVDAIRAPLAPLAAPLAAATTIKLVHSARQDVEALYLSAGCLPAPLFDTQVAAGCTGLKPQIGYAELVATLLGVHLDKAHTRTDWSRRPLSAEQLAYAADDVRYLEEVAARLQERLRALGRERWVTEDCATLGDPSRLEPDPARAWERLRAIAQLPPRPRARAKAIAEWRERLARERNLPRGWILPDAAIFAIAHSGPTTAAQLAAVDGMPESFNSGFAQSLLARLADLPHDAAGMAESAPDPRPTDAQKALAERLVRILDACAAELGVSAEVLATRGQIRAIAMGRRDVEALSGWRREMIGDRLLAAI